MTRLDKERLNKLEEELGDLDFCQYLGVCDKVEDAVMENFCVLNYLECPYYAFYKKIDVMRIRMKGGSKIK